MKTDKTVSCLFKCLGSLYLFINKKLLFLELNELDSEEKSS